MEQSQKFLERRRFAMALPLLALPFITMIFWALGGGKGIEQQPAAPQAGLNLDIPGASLPKDAADMNKLSVYEQARLDSQKYEQDKRLDPYFQFATLEEANGKKAKEDSKLLGSDPTKAVDMQGVSTSQADENEKAVQEKLAQLTRHLEQSTSRQPQPDKVSHAPASVNKHADQSTDVDRLEALMENIHEGGETDADMNQIAEVLDKILDVQHPERVAARLKAFQESELAAAQEVLPAGESEYRTVLSGHTTNASDSNSYTLASQEVNRFYTLDEFVYKQSASNAIEAVVEGEQVVVSGGMIKMRLLSDLVIQRQRIPANTFVFGSCSIKGERLTISIKSIGHDAGIFPVNLSVYDLDGQEGLFVPGAIIRDAAKTASSQMLQGVQLYSMDPSLAAQAASAGVQAATGLLSKKAKLVKLTVKAGYRILLRDSRSQSSTI